MTDEQVQQYFDQLDQRLVGLLQVLQQIADNLRQEERDLVNEITAIDKLPQQLEIERALRAPVPRGYLAGRWKQRDGDGYFQPPPPAPKAAVVHDDNPPGPLRPPGVSGN